MLFSPDREMLLDTSLSANVFTRSEPVLWRETDGVIHGILKALFAAQVRKGAFYA
jgi:hypothetical protein